MSSHSLKKSTPSIQFREGYYFTETNFMGPSFKTIQKHSVLTFKQKALKTHKNAHELSYSYNCLGYIFKSLFSGIITLYSSLMVSSKKAICLINMCIRSQLYLSVGKYTHVKR